MPGANDIVIVYAYLDTLASNALSAAGLLAESSAAMSLTFPGNEAVDGVYDDFLGEWDKHREQLRASIEGAGSAFQAVSAAFVAAEEQLIAALNGG
ncbi:MAG TPA: hypothetical protein VMM60_05465 [Ilumatobacter sp.]|nr:hypothetical protein [Ilumatobacter sp.]